MSAHLMDRVRFWRGFYGRWNCTPGKLTLDDAIIIEAQVQRAQMAAEAAFDPKKRTIVRRFDPPSRTELRAIGDYMEK